MWTNTAERERLQIMGMRIACWIPKATNTHSEYVILIAFPLQQWSHERASMLRYTYTACIVSISFILQSFNSNEIILKKSAVVRQRGRTGHPEPELPCSAAHFNSFPPLQYTNYGSTAETKAV